MRQRVREDALEAPAGARAGGRRLDGSTDQRLAADIQLGCSAEVAGRTRRSACRPRMLPVAGVDAGDVGPAAAPATEVEKSNT